ncbi:hypothetical protein [Streptomyces bikiniensis]|uniref:hypothetical protein n=1 Tax=Streptomyces bikiniensis TaxID=1896 RepID=UPI00389A0315
MWVYRPDAMAGRGDGGQWVVYDVDGGAVIARRELETAGHGALHRVHPVDGSVHLDVGEGQDGSVVLRGRAGVGGEPEFATYPWQDRCLIDLSPDGERFMTFDRGRADVAFHRHPEGDVLLTLPVEAFGYDPEETFVEWSGGYLTPEPAVVTLGGEGRYEEEWFRHHLVDVRTGVLRGEIDLKRPARTTWSPWVMAPGSPATPEATPYAGRTPPRLPRPRNRRLTGRRRTRRSGTSAPESAPAFPPARLPGRAGAGRGVRVRQEAGAPAARCIKVQACV